MTRNSYSKDFEEIMSLSAPYKTFDELLKFAKLFYDIDREQLRKYLSKRKIRYKDYNGNMINVHNILPIGSEYRKPDGMILIKIANDKWEYKQRYIYEQYHRINLPTSTMVIFLDGNKNNFDINNLMAVESKEYNFCRNKDLLSIDSEVTKTAMLAARLYYKAKEKNDE